MRIAKYCYECEPLPYHDHGYPWCNMRWYACFSGGGLWLENRYPKLGERRTCVCLWYNFLLFWTKYIRYLMSLLCIFFMRVLVWDYWVFDKVFVHGSSYPGCDVNKGVYFPSVILYHVNWWVIFGVFWFQGLVGESIVAICEFYELDYVWRRGL